MTFSKRTYTYLLVFSFILLSSCSRTYDYTPHNVASHDGNFEKEQLSLPTFPIPIEDGFFNSGVGFISNDTFLFVSENTNHSSLYSYHLPTGNQELIFENDYPIVSVEISPKGNYYLIHSALSSHQALIIILDRQGSIIFQKEVPSVEINFDWNYENENKVLLTAFLEDWTYSVFELSMDTGEMKELPLPQPFGYWLGEDEILYLDWHDDPSIFAPLYSYHVDKEEEREVFQNIFHIDTFDKYFFTVTTDGGNKEEAKYEFYNTSIQKVMEFKVPHLSRFSGYLVPFYSYLSEKNQLLLLEPLYYSEVDIYGDGFQWVLYDLKSEERTVLMEDMPNEPVSCSHDGRYCLSGYYLEKLVNLSTKEVKELVKW